jgi:uncharacterized membrane protein
MKKMIVRFLGVSIIVFILIAIILNWSGVITALRNYPIDFIVGYVVSATIFIVFCIIYRNQLPRISKNNEKDEDNEDVEDVESDNSESSYKYGTVNPPLPISHKYER